MLAYQWEASTNGYTGIKTAIESGVKCFILETSAAVVA